MPFFFFAALPGDFCEFSGISTLLCYAHSTSLKTYYSHRLLPQNIDIFLLPDKAHYAMMPFLDSKWE